MRWSGQQVLDDGVGTDTALPGLRGLLRSVRPPEFAGTVFHEVEARSLLNRVPASSRMPFGWTVNPYRGCGHACVYCLDGDTSVLLADGGTRPIAELVVGDTVVGTEPAPGGGRRYVPTRVRAHWTTVRPAHRVRLADGTALVTSGEHRFLTGRGWRHVAPGWCRRGRRPHLRRGELLLGPGAGARRAPAVTPAYRDGYLCGLVRGDATHPAARGEAFPSERLPLEVVARAHHLLAVPAPRACPEPRLVLADGAIRPRSPWPDADAAAPGPGTAHGWPLRPGSDWNAGFVAGVLDALGSAERGELRLQAVGPAAAELFARWAGAARALGLRVVAAAEPGERHVALVAGGAAGARRVLDRVAPAAAALHDLAGAAVEALPGHEVVAVEGPGAKQPMYDITTGTGDFVAAGVVNHNCFARNSHTYLDLDAGADFDSRLVVKVNAVRVLERELRAPRWRREPVAMGTNTDPYQRAEGRYRLMPGIIAALARSGTPLSILTKGTLLSRDLPELVAASADVTVGLGVSIALLDRPLQARLEPGAPSPQARLDLVRRITDAGLSCGVMVAPVLPHLTDSEEALDALLARIAAAGATGATALALHLRPGAREWFLCWLHREHPALVPVYERLYRRGANADPDYRAALRERLRPLLGRHGLAATTTPMRPRAPSEPAPSGPAPAGSGSSGRPPAGTTAERFRGMPADPAPPAEQLRLL